MSEIGDKLETYEDFQDIDLIDECSIVLNFFLLNCLDCKLLVGFSVFRQINNAETPVGKLLLERVHLFNVALCGVHEVKLMSAAFYRACRARTTCAC